MNFLPLMRRGRSRSLASGEAVPPSSGAASRSMSRAWGAAVASVAMVVASLGPIATGAQATDARYYDGSSSERAAASCWEIKQNKPNARSGAYWLYTPQMSAPEQFYCDQETDGGGWVMIGRGRESWTENYNGRGNAEQLYKNPTGFDAVQLPGQTVNALLNGTRPQDLPDGVRFHRAMNVEGTTWQDFTARRDSSTEWTWTLRAKMYWSNFSVRNTWQYSSRYNYFSRDQVAGNIFTHDSDDFRSLHFVEKPSQGYKLGFTYGPHARITWWTETYLMNRPSAYIYRPANDYSTPLVFTQIFLRPKVTQNDLAAKGLHDYGQQGAEASNRRALPNSYSEKWKWRTSRTTGTGKNGEMNTQVEAITEVGGAVFTGGDFAYVESASGEKVDQAFLAAYEVGTGELRRSFRPSINGQVKSVEALPNGLLAVGGSFTRVNGENHNGFVLLDPKTGQVAEQWDIHVQSRISSLPVQVKTLHVRDGYLYLGGSFTHVKGNTSATYAYSRNLARIKLSNGEVDWNWRPVFNGTVNGVSASEGNTHVYVAGYFTQLNGGLAFRIANITNPRQSGGDWSQEPSYIPGDARTWDLRNERLMWGFQFDVQDAGSSVWLGGTEHMISRYDKSSMRRTDSAITREGGDFQDLHLSGKTIYGACHCGDFLFQGADKVFSEWVNATDAQTIRLVAAFDKDSGKMLPEWAPIMSGAHGYGVWESFVDSTGTLWVGGDLNKSLGANGVQETVGFARFAARDVTPPETPQNLKVRHNGAKDQLSWSAVSERHVTYQVLRDDRPIATVSGTNFSVDHRDDAKYYVRAVDTSGNYSASTQAVRAA